MSVGQPAYPCAEIGGVVFTYMGPGEPPALPAYEFFASAPARFQPTKVLCTENYLQGISAAKKPPLDGDRFVVPNLVLSQGSLSSAESSLRWYVPVDDNSHVEFTLRYPGELSITGDPMSAAQQVLLDAIEKVAVNGEVGPNQP
jgi:hypothetical protein